MTALEDFRTLDEAETAWSFCASSENEVGRGQQGAVYACRGDEAAYVVKISAVSESSLREFAYFEKVLDRASSPYVQSIQLNSILSASLVPATALARILNETGEFTHLLVKQKRYAMTLREWIGRQSRQCDGDLNTEDEGVDEQWLEVFSQARLCLLAMHAAGFMHGDPSPENVMVDVESLRDEKHCVMEMRLPDGATLAATCNHIRVAFVDFGETRHVSQVSNDLPWPVLNAYRTGRDVVAFFHYFYAWHARDALRSVTGSSSSDPSNLTAYLAFTHPDEKIWRQRDVPKEKVWQVFDSRVVRCNGAEHQRGFPVRVNRRFRKLFRLFAKCRDTQGYKPRYILRDPVWTSTAFAKVLDGLAPFVASL